MFVKFSCDCIGIPLDGKKAVIVDACDEGGDRPADSLSWATRDVSDKTFTALDPEKERHLHARIARRFGRADRFDEIKLALDV